MTGENVTCKRSFLGHLHFRTSPNYVSNDENNVPRCNPRCSWWNIFANVSTKSCAYMYVTVGRNTDICIYIQSEVKTLTICNIFVICNNMERCYIQNLHDTTTYCTILATIDHTALWIWIMGDQVNTCRLNTLGQVNLSWLCIKQIFYITLFHFSSIL